MEILVIIMLGILFILLIYNKHKIKDKDATIKKLNFSTGRYQHLLN